MDSYIELFILISFKQYIMSYLITNDGSKLFYEESGSGNY